MKKHQSHRYIFIKIVLLFSIIFSCGVILFIVLPKPSYKSGFNSLKEIQGYAEQTSENIPLDTDNTIKPDFTTYYKKFIPTWKSSLQEKLVWLLTLLKIKSAPAWSTSFFKTQLDDIIQQRTKVGFKDNFICKVTPTEQSKIVIFGNIQGAFHSLVRYCQKLKELGILDDNLKVGNNHIIIFTGDVISRSPYTMETLALVMKLAFLNPESVVYLRGNHESAGYWQEHTLKTELQIRAAHLGTGTIPLADQIDSLFSTLPLAAYIMMQTINGDCVRISDSGRGQNELLNETRYASFLTTPSSHRISYHNLSNELTGDTTSSVNVKVIFKGEKKRETYQPHNGLRLLPPDMGSTAWTVLSCPTPVYQKAIKFMHDAFVIITPASAPDNWKVTLYNRNVQTKEPFKETTYSLISGVEETAGLTSPPPPQEQQSAPSKTPSTDEEQKKISAPVQTQSEGTVDLSQNPTRILRQAQDERVPITYPSASLDTTQDKPRAPASGETVESFERTNTNFERNQVLEQAKKIQQNIQLIEDQATALVKQLSGAQQIPQESPSTSTQQPDTTKTPVEPEELPSQQTTAFEPLPTPDDSNQSGKASKE